MLRVVYVAVALVSLEADCVIAKDSLPLDKVTYKDSAGKELPFRLMKPLNVVAGTKYPLVIFLHGAGERGTDNEKQLVHGIPQFIANREKHPCFLIVPQCPVEQKWVEVDWSAETHKQPKTPGDAGRMVIELIEQSLKQLPVDANRVYLTGLSMGGYGAWDMAARRPDLFAAIAPVCGGGDEATANKIKKIPTWAFHGGKDGVVKPARSRNMIHAIKKAGGNPKYTEYQDVGHDSWNNAYKDPLFHEWLFAQKK